MATLTLEHRITITHDIGDADPKQMLKELDQQMHDAIRREYDNGALSTDDSTIDRWDMSTKQVNHDD